MLRKFFKVCAAGCIGFALFATIAWFAVAWRASGVIATTPEGAGRATAALVPGTSARVPGGGRNLYFERRMDAAAALFRAGKVEYLIVSGNQARGGRAKGGYDEPTDMRDALVERGVPAERVYRDYAGFRTLDPVLRAKEIFGQERVIVVSQRFQIERALFLARAHGAAFEGFAAKDPPWRHRIRTQAREVFARMGAMIDVVIDRRAKHGGQTVALGRDPPT